MTVAPEISRGASREARPKAKVASRRRALWLLFLKNYKKRFVKLSKAYKTRAKTRIIKVRLRRRTTAWPCVLRMNRKSRISPSRDRICLRAKTSKVRGAGTKVMKAKVGLPLAAAGRLRP